MKSFLEEYGLIIVAVVVILAFIVFASTFGERITGAIETLIDTFLTRSGVVVPAPEG